MSLKQQINKGELEGLATAIKKRPFLVNEVIKWGPLLKNKSHPLHYLCDRVFNQKLDSKLAGEMAILLIDHGANINGYGFEEMKDTPLVAAASLRSDEVAIVLIDTGADIHHRGCMGGTALHWAAWCGRDRVVERLLKEEIDIDRRCISNKSTAFFWAAHGRANGKREKDNRNQLLCARMLKDAGADISIPNAENMTAAELLKEDTAFLAIINDHDI